MTKKENLIFIKEDYARRGTPIQIHLIYKDGKKAGIGNPDAIKKVMETLNDELDRQINEL